MPKEKILVTGAAGFIGFHLSNRLCKQGHKVIGIDNLNDYYDVTLKESRLNQLNSLEGFQFHKIDIQDSDSLNEIVKNSGVTKIVHLAAQAGVRYSLDNPKAYIDSNISAFLNILETSRHNGIEHLVYASSSSVYGANKKMPFSEKHNIDHPVSLYAATKKSNELMAHSYSSLFNIPVTGLRFFTVYGPYGRPDMALFLFTKAILEGKPINVFNEGNLKRDFTYVDDIVESIVRLLPNIPTGDPDWNAMDPQPDTSYAPYRIFNIGHNKPVELLRFIELIEDNLGKKAIKNMMPMQQGDVTATYANIDNLSSLTGYSPSTSIEEGIKNFVDWYKEYYPQNVDL